MHRSTSDWQVMFRKGEDQLPLMNLADARNRGYVFDLTNGRLVFRTPYGQPDSSSTEVNAMLCIRFVQHLKQVLSVAYLQVNGVPVEVVHATLFSRQSWLVLMVDMVAACSRGRYCFLILCS